MTASNGRLPSPAMPAPLVATAPAHRSTEDEPTARPSKEDFDHEKNTDTHDDSDRHRRHGRIRIRCRPRGRPNPRRSLLRRLGLLRRGSVPPSRSAVPRGSWQPVGELSATRSRRGTLRLSMRSQRARERSLVRSGPRQRADRLSRHRETTVDLPLARRYAAARPSHPERCYPEIDVIEDGEIGSPVRTLLELPKHSARSVQLIQPAPQSASSPSPTTR